MKSFAVLALAVILGPAALAEHQTFTANPDASEVKIKLNTTHEVVNGTFHIQSGSIEFDRSNPKMSGSVAVLAGSGKTGNDSRDKKMNKDILKVDQYTTVSFAPKTYTGTIAPSGDSTIQVSGVFTLLGNTSRPDDSDADSHGWIEGNGEGAIRRSLCSVGSQEPELHVLES